MLGCCCGIPDLKKVWISSWKSDNPVSSVDKFWEKFGQFVKIILMEDIWIFITGRLTYQTFKVIDSTERC